MKRHIFLTVLAALTLGACEQETVSSATYSCEGGQVLNVTFTDGQNVSVEIAGRVHSIPRTESSSGAKYELQSTGTIFWSKGMDVNFVEYKDAPVLKCRRI